MSHVADILLLTMLEDGGSKSVKECPNADALSDWLAEHYNGCRLVQFDGLAGGNKAMQANVFGTAINYCDIPALVAAFRAIKWEYPESAQLLVKDEHDDTFTMYRPEG